MSRSKAKIDIAILEAMVKVGATNCEIADHFGVDEGTIRKRFSEILTKNRSGRKIRLRQLQWQQAEAGSIPMLIWLGKNVLDQSDKQEIKEISEQKISIKELDELKDSQLTEEYKKSLE